MDKITGALARMRLQEDWEMDELTASIKQNGILNPLMLNRTSKGYILFAGHRRLKAARSLHMNTVPAIVYDDIPEAEAAMKGFIDNLNRKDFTPLEQAYAYKTLSEKYGYTYKEISSFVAKSMSEISSYIGLINKVPKEILDALVGDKISFGHAKLLMRIPDQKLMMKLFRQLMEEEMIPVKDLRYKLVRMKADEDLDPEEKALDTVEDLIESDSKLQKLWRSEINIHRSRIGDKLEIDYRNSTDLVKKLEILLSALRKTLKIK